MRRIISFERYIFCRYITFLAKFEFLLLAWVVISGALLLVCLLLFVHVCDTVAHP